MSATLTDPQPVRAGVYRHEALIYDGDDGFVEATAPFVAGAVAAQEPVLVLVGPHKIELLREALGADAEAVHFADMTVVGRNPARIIPAWARFLEEYAAGGRAVRGIGEPIYAARTPAELVECQRHESLLNVAVPDTLPLWLVCPYDRESLSPAVVEEALRSHPFVSVEGTRAQSSAHRPAEMATDHLRDPLPEPTRVFGELTFGPEQLGVLRRMITIAADRFSLGPDRTQDFLLAVNEIATNSLVHGGGYGSCRLWREGRSLVCEISDLGRLDDPLVGRQQPDVERPNGRGLWLANQLCDLVQIRSFPTGSVVRLHMTLGG